MIHRPYDEQAIYGSFDKYDEWKAKAGVALVAVREAIQLGRKPAFDAKIYGRLKQFQLAWFREKCAYCEINISAGFWGDVEHYRPKKGVTGEDGHPGYYWLAYDPSNLMPCCQRCNQGGKKNHFPVQPGTRAFREEDLATERPLLLNPYFDRPSEHLHYDFDAGAGNPTGFVKALSEKGRASIDIYGLNRQPLADQRMEAQQNAITGYKLARTEKDLDRFFDAILAGRQSYTAARVSAVVQYIDWDKARLDREKARPLNPDR